MKTRLRAATGLLPLLIGSCSPYSLAKPASPPLQLFGPPVRTDVATLCVIRPSHTALAVTFAVHDNDQVVGATCGESYFCYQAEPGRHRIVSSTKDPVDTDGSAQLTAEAGRRYWLLQDFDNVFGAIKSKLQWVEESRARDLMDGDGAVYKVIVGVPGDEALPGAVPFARAAAAATTRARE